MTLRSDSSAAHAASADRAAKQAADCRHLFEARRFFKMNSALLI
jgi:hypothetical protein